MMRKLILLMMLVASITVTAQVAITTEQIQGITKTIDVGKILNDLKSRIAPDKRVAIWDDVRYIEVAVDAKEPVVSGTVGFQWQEDSIIAELDRYNINYRSLIKVLSNKVPAEKQWALVKLSIATLRCEPKHSGEVATQGIMGMPLRVIEIGEWCRVQCPDGYIAYVPESSLKFVSQQDLDAWKGTDRYIVTVYDDQLVSEP